MFPTPLILVPLNFEAVLKHYTIQGYRVLALAKKDFSPHLSWEHVCALSREELEHHVQLVGLLIVRNQLKKETLPTLRVLHEARIKTVMITGNPTEYSSVNVSIILDALRVKKNYRSGDNLQTAITVAKDCMMIDPPTKRIIQVCASFVPYSINGVQHLEVTYKDPMVAPEFFKGTVTKLRDVHSGDYCMALDGQTFESLRIHDPALLQKVIVRAKVFARMSSENKQHLIETLQLLG